MKTLASRSRNNRMSTGAALVGLAVMSALMTACGGDDDDAPLPQLTPATGAALTTCTDLTTRFGFANTSVAAASAVAAGALTIAGTPVGAHCQVTGSMFPRVSPVDGKAYAIGFEMRLPNAWNGRYFYQANGGTDGVVGTASGGIGGGGPLTHALQQGFAVLTSDAGHNAAQNPTFGIDPQARLDYGYQAVAKLTPMAKALIGTAYGKGPDRSYLGGCSNGGRHALVAASRYGDLYDGIIAGDPGFNLPQAAVAQMYGAQQYATVATSVGSGLADITTSFTPAELNTVSARILAKCDALDGIADGLVSDVKACGAAFNLAADVPGCVGPTRDGSCLTTAQKTVLQNVHTGARNSVGAALYTSFPWDAGISGANWRAWKFGFSVNIARDPGATGFVFQTPPVTAITDGAAFAFGFSMDTDAPKIFATNATYAEASMSFMTPPHPSDLSVLKNRGAKLLIYHGTADPVFSADDTVRYYQALRDANGGDASNFARYFPVPGMNHCSGGPTVDQFNMLDALVGWVERGVAPATVTATARGAGNAGGVNAEVPAAWAANRSRPLCPYPSVATYGGSGSVETAASFSCR